MFTPTNLWFNGEEINSGEATVDTALQSNILFFFTKFEFSNVALFHAQLIKKRFNERKSTDIYSSVGHFRIMKLTEILKAHFMASISISIM